MNELRKDDPSDELLRQPNQFALPSHGAERSSGTGHDRLEDERGRLIRDSVYLFSAGTGVTLVFFLALAPDETSFLAVGFAPFLLLFLSALILVHRGAPKLSALTVVIGVTVLQALSSVLLPSQAPEALVSMLNLLLFAGFTLGPLAAIVLSLVAAAGVVTVLYVLPDGLNSTPLLQIPASLPLDTLSNASLVTTTLTTGGLVALTVHHVVRARQRESEAQLKIGEVNKLEAIGRLSAGIAHDFNNLLATIIGSAELGRSNIQKGQSPEDELERIELAGRRGAELIRKLLSFAQPGSLFPESFDLVQHFRSVAPALPGNSGDSAVLKIQLPTSPIWIRSRPIDVEQVVFNLLQNALEASAPSSPIEFSIERAPPPAGLDAAEAVRIRVRDQGCGMTEDTLARIFDPFFTTRSDSGGNGLGLAVSYGLIQSGGGTIEVRSVPDHGSCFDVWFSEVPTPIQRTVKSAPPPTEAVSEEPRALQTQRRVLVVEDNRDVREVVVALLQDHGFRVESSPSGAAAMKTLEEIGDFAVLVSDVVMPELGGIELLRELRARGNDLPVLLMSGFSPQDLEGQDHLQPFVMLAKPFSRRALLDSIDSLTGLVDSASSGVL